MSTLQIAILVGSLRKASYNLKIANSLPKLSPSSLDLNFIDISTLPFYNEDIDTETPPESYQQFRSQLSLVDAVLFVTPEYNRSMPAVIKNALDVGSRPYGKAALNTNKPAAIITASPGSVGGFGANHHLRQSLTCLGMPCMQQPEAYIGSVHHSLDESGEPNESLTTFLAQFMISFEKWIRHFHS